MLTSHLSPVAIGAMATEIRGSDAPLRDAFRRDRALLLHDAFDPAFLAAIMARAGAATFVEDDVFAVGQRRIEAPQRVSKVLTLALARPGFLGWVAEVTGSEPFGAVEGRLYESHADRADRLVWHDDLNGPLRRIAIVINLSDRRHEGGLFELRRKGEEQPRISHRHDLAGALMLFAVHPELEHRVTPLESGGPRRVYSGWFLAS